MHNCAVLFDCDGTLIDSEDQVIRSIALAIAKVKGPKFGHKEIKDHFGPGADIILDQLLKDRSRVSLAFEYYLESQRELVHEMHLYDGILDLLSHLKNKGIPMGIVTGRHRRDLDIVLSAFELMDYFSVIVSDDELRAPKPSPEGLLLAAERLSLSATDLFYTGDAKGDLEAAHMAGAKGIAALWDKRVQNEEMWNESPFLMARSPMDIWDKVFLPMKVRAQSTLTL